MKIWLVAVNTFRGLVRNRGLLVLALLFLFPYLMSVGWLYYISRLETAGAVEQSRLLLANQLEGTLRTNAVFAFILAVAAAFMLPGEIRTGTVLPTLGRALSRLEFLLGLYLGLNLLLVTYFVVASVATWGLLVWGGMATEPYLLWGLLYAFLVANLVAAMTFFFAAAANHAALAPVGTVFFLMLPSFMEGVKLWSQEWGERLQTAARHLLPAWDLLDYQTFFSLTRSPVPRAAELHLVGIVHALDYLAVFLLLTWLAFRRRSLLPPS